MNNTKKPMNSLFLNYLLSNQSKVDTNAEKWLESKNILDNISEISDEINEYLVSIMACWGEIGWCLPKCKERDIKLGKVLIDLKNNIFVTKEFLDGIGIGKKSDAIESAYTWLNVNSEYILKEFFKN